MRLREIIEQYPKLGEIVIERTHTYDVMSGRDRRRVSQLVDTSIMGLFSWNNTLEGMGFWSSIEHGNINRAKSMFPEYFEQPVIGLASVKTSGLWV